MNKKIVWLFVIFVIASLSVLPASAAQTSNEQEALQISVLINEYRQESGLYLYVYNPVLAATAQAHSEYQASIEESTHYGEGDSRSRDRAEVSGYGGGKYIFVSEMIYAGQFATPQAALQWWKNSPIHNGIMLSEDYDEFGVGVAYSDTRIYYTVNVGRVRGVTAPGVGSAAEISPRATSVPVTVSPADEFGAIYHQVKEGQTLSGIAEAYDMEIEELRLINSMTEDAKLNVGQLVLIQQPQATEPVVVEESQSPPEPTVTIDESIVLTDEAEEATPTAQGFSAVLPTEADGQNDSGGGPVGVVPTQAVGGETGGGINWLVIVLVAVAVLGSGAFAYLSLVQGRDSGDEDEDEEHNTSAFRYRSRREQFELLREVAEVAMDEYPLDVVKIELLRYVLNAEFLVDAMPEAGGEVEKYVVRVNAPGFQSRAEIASELDWLQALNEETKLNVPNPVRKRNGDWVATVEQLFLDEPRHCVLFEYIPGHTIEMEATPAHLEVVGAVIGLLHKHGAQFDPPPGFVRKHWDLEGLTGGLLDVPAEQAYGALSAHELGIVKEAEKLVEEAMDTIGRTEETYGLIHADLHLKSFLFHKGKPLVLDFDTCGYGYYAYDLAVPVWNLFHRDDFGLLKASLLKGYRRVRPLSEQEENLLIHFVAGRLMSQILAWAGRREHSNITQVADQAIKKEIGQLELLIRLLVE